jgi:hypothetical protein
MKELRLIIPCTTILCTSGSIRVARQERGSTGKEIACASRKECSQQWKNQGLVLSFYALVLWSHCTQNGRAGGKSRHGATVLIKN